MDRYRRLLPLVHRILESPSLGRSVLPLSSAFTLLNVDGTRKFSTSRPAQSPNFDTLKIVERLEAQGFTPEQSKAVMQLLKDVIDESVLGLTRTMVTREEQDKVTPYDTGS